MMMDEFQEALALTEQIHREMMNPNQTLDEMSKYYFDGQGKAVRPALTLIMAGACNSHLQVYCAIIEEISPLEQQLCITKVFGPYLRISVSV